MGIELALSIIGLLIGGAGFGIKVVEGIAKIDRKLNESHLKIDFISSNVKEIKEENRCVDMRISAIENYLTKTTDFNVRH